eukprot:8746021-Pyramimonas_sp.AAC.1
MAAVAALARESGQMPPPLMLMSAPRLASSWPPSFAASASSGLPWASAVPRPAAGPPAVCSRSTVRCLQWTQPGSML